MKKRFFLFPAFAGVAAYFSFSQVFTMSDEPLLTNINHQTISPPHLHCFRSEGDVALDVDGQIDMLVWNIYKQNRDQWQQALTTLSQGKQLLLLQEASMTQDMKQWIIDSGWYGNQANAFKAFDTPAGVLNLSKDTPLLACAYMKTEPWLRLPKSAIYARYPLSNGETLAVVNVHAVNFTLGVKAYRQQLHELEVELSQHQGPIVIAGDFNSWSEKRLTALRQALLPLKLQEVSYAPDERKRFITGYPLDHVFFRGLTLKSAEAPINDASDHNPLVVRFQVKAK